MPSNRSIDTRSVAAPQAGARSEKPSMIRTVRNNGYIFTPKCCAHDPKVWFEDTIARRYA